MTDPQHAPQTFPARGLLLPHRAAARIKREDSHSSACVVRGNLARSGGDSASADTSRLLSAHLALPSNRLCLLCVAVEGSCRETGDMYKLDLPVDLKEAAVLQRRRDAELQRQSRVFDARVRTVGVRMPG